MLSFILILLFSLQEETIDLGSVPLAPNAARIKLIHTIKPVDGFYSQIDSKIRPDGVFCIYDMGNKRIHVYGKNGEESAVFGNEGNGPFELNGYETIHSLQDDFLVLISWDKIILFSYEGKRIGEIRARVSHNIDFFKNRVRFNYENKAYKFREYSFDGKELSVKKNLNYKKTEKERLSNLASERKKHILNFTKPYGKTEFAGGTAHFYKGKYKLSLEKNGKTRYYTRKFDRIKREKYRGFIRLSAKDKELEKKYNAMYVETMKRLTEGFHNDIMGMKKYNEYLFVLTKSAKKTELSIDILNKSFNYYTKIELDEEDPFIVMDISDKYILLSPKNDSDGPYLNVYKMTIN
jgi:hypothetical protein